MPAAPLASDPQDSGFQPHASDASDSWDLVIEPGRTEKNYWADLCFSSSVLALAGGNANEPDVTGRYVRSARQLRTVLIAVVGLASAACFPLISEPYGWDFGVKGGSMFLM